MCGVLGFVKTSDLGTGQQMKDFIRCMFVVDQFRGEHSTGMFTVPKLSKAVTYDPTPTVFKRAVNAMDFMNIGYVDKVLDNLKDYQFFVGHNRYATKGSLNNLNAHPFQVGGITAVHNGTIHNFTKYAGDTYMFTVDSHALTYLVDTKGFVDALAAVRGAYTYIWHDVADNSLNFIRNKDRPLLFADAPWGVVFGSERWMLKAAAEYSKVELQNIRSINEYQHVKITPRIDGNKILMQEETTDLKAQLDPFPENNWGHRQNNWNNQQTASGSKAVVPIKPDADKNRAENLLKTYGLKIGDEVSFVIDKFVPYNKKGNTFGTALGYAYNIEKNMTLGIMINAVPQEFIEYINEDDVDQYDITGKISGAIYEANHSNPSVHCTYAIIENVQASILTEEEDSILVVKIKDKYDGDNPLDVDILDLIDDEEDEEKESDTQIIASVGLDSMPNARLAIPIANTSDYEIRTESEWKVDSSDGCCHCTGNLIPMLINPDTNEIAQKPNCVVDLGDNIWCNECWDQQVEKMLH